MFKVNDRVKLVHTGGRPSHDGIPVGTIGTVLQDDGPHPGSLIEVDFGMRKSRLFRHRVELVESVEVEAEPRAIVPGDIVEIATADLAPDFLGFVAEVIGDGEPGHIYYRLKPLSERPDGFGLSSFNWSKTEVRLVDVDPDGESKVTQVEQVPTIKEHGRYLIDDRRNFEPWTAHETPVKVRAVSDLDGLGLVDEFGMVWVEVLEGHGRGKYLPVHHSRLRPEPTPEPEPEQQVEQAAWPLKVSDHDNVKVELEFGMVILHHDGQELVLSAEPDDDEVTPLIDALTAARDKRRELYGVS